MSLKKTFATDKRRSSEIERRQSELDKLRKSVADRRVTIGSVYQEGDQMTQEDVLVDSFKENKPMRPSTGKANKKDIPKNKCKHCLGICFREVCEFLKTCFDTLC